MTSISGPRPDAAPASSGDAVPGLQALPDVQGFADHRRIPIDRVGVTEVRYPVVLRTPGGGRVHTVATVGMQVSLPADRKGTHMSRFLEVLGEFADGLEPVRTAELVEAMRDRLDAETAHVDLAFTYFVNKLAPVTQKPGLLDYDVRFRATATAGATTDVRMEVAAAATSLCPCSKEISAYGAHNQRCRIVAEVRCGEPMWIEDLAEILESAASCEVYSVLKRPDEKFVTEEAFKNPKFVEDIVRDLAGSLDRDDRVAWYRISSENFESIHGHNAFAEIVRDKGDARD